MRSGGFIFIRVSSVRTASSVRHRWCGETSAVTPTPARLGRRDGADGRRAAQVLEVQARRRALVLGQLGVAGDHGRLADARDAGDAEQRADLALVHDAGARQRGVLLVQGQHAAAQPLVLQRAAQHPGAHDRAAVVGEAQRALLAQLGHLRQLAALAGRG